MDNGDPLSQQAEALLALSERAPAGPWTASETERSGSSDGKWVYGATLLDGFRNWLVHAVAKGEVDKAQMEAMLAFIAAARTTAPALAAAYLAMRWRTMDSAPRDGTIVLLYVPGSVYWDTDYCILAFWGDETHGFERRQDPDNWWFSCEADSNPILGTPTHWLPLPTPPTGGDHEAQG